MAVLTKTELRNVCNSTTYSRGLELFRNKSVEEIVRTQEEDRLTVSSDVRGSTGTYYRTSLTLRYDDTDHVQIVRAGCSCPASGQWYGICKHCVALGIAYMEQEKVRVAGGGVESVTRTSVGLSRFLSQYRAAAANLEHGYYRGTVKLTPELTCNEYRFGIQWLISCRIGVGRMYVVKNLATMVNHVLCGAPYEYGKNLSFVHAYDMFDPASQRVFSIVERVVRAAYPNVDRSDYSYESQMRAIQMQEADVAAFLDQAAGGTITISEHTVNVVDGDPPLCMKIEPGDASGATMEIPTLAELLPEPFGYYDCDNTLYRCTPDFLHNVLPFLRAVGAVTSRYKSVSQKLSQEDYNSFCSYVLPRLEPLMEIRIKEINFDEFKPKKPEFQFYLSEGVDMGVLLRPTVSYGACAYPLLRVGAEYRNDELEAPVHKLLEPYMENAASHEETLDIRDEDTLYRLLHDGLEEFRKTGEVLIDESLRSLRIAPSPKTKIGVGLKGNLIDLDVQVDAFSQEELQQILTAYRRKKKFYRLKNGEFLTLEDGSVSVLAELSDTLRLPASSLGHAEVPAFRAHYLNAVLAGTNEDVTVERSTEFKQTIRNLRDYSDSDYLLPDGLHAELRNYQKAGYRWLRTLCDQNLCGILADDMGLGKTLQIIALLWQRRSRSLIVCPASLLYNWESEIAKFAPGLRVQLITGSAQQRMQLLQTEAQVYVTSYDLLKRDTENYAGQEYDCVILDEAQYIRNAGTQAAKAVKTLHAAHRFALTGTPIENRLSDLWSIFDFLMPGYLYSYRQFRESLEAPIIDDDADAASRLKRMITPFVLRRKKGDVLRELPDKVESVRYIELTQEQRMLYDAQEQALRRSILDADDSSFAQNKLQYLSALTRLRQLCCTPELYLEGYHGGSGKMDACMDLLEEAAENGHKTLVFSQFTTMLEALQAEAEKREISCLYLCGKHTKEQRRDMVQTFQEGNTNAFFISLKAGGTGLNLTAADRVIHFDPWWNYAAENQATDRTHRIGQKNTVFVTKLVAKNTVEEKIIALQNAKQALSESVLSGGEIASERIDRDELLKLLQAR